MNKPLKFVLILTSLFVVSCSSNHDRTYLTETIFDEQDEAVDVSPLENAIIDSTVRLHENMKSSPDLKLPQWQPPVLQCGVHVPAQKANGTYLNAHKQCVRITTGGNDRNSYTLLPR